MPQSCESTTPSTQARGLVAVRPPPTGLDLRADLARLDAGRAPKQRPLGALAQGRVDRAPRPARDEATTVNGWTQTIQSTNLTAVQEV